MNLVLVRSTLVLRCTHLPLVLPLCLLFFCLRRRFGETFRLQVTDYNTQFSGITAEMLKGKQHLDECYCSEFSFSSSSCLDLLNYCYSVRQYLPFAFHVPGTTICGLTFFLPPPDAAFLSLAGLQG